MRTDVIVVNSRGKAMGKALEQVEVSAPAPLGTVVIEKVCGTDANVVTCREL